MEIGHADPVRHDGALVPIPGRMARRLLVALATTRNGVDQYHLTDALWGAEPPTARLRLHASCPGLITNDTDIVLGQRDLRIVLVRAGAIAGSVLLGPDQCPEDVVIVLKLGDRGWVPEVGGDGSFEQGDLPSGRFRLVAYLRSTSDEERAEVSPEITGQLYCYPPDVDALWEALRGKVEVVSPLADWDHGMREFQVRDCNGYVLRFGQEIERAAGER